MHELDSTEETEFAQAIAHQTMSTCNGNQRGDNSRMECSQPNAEQDSRTPCVIARLLNVEMGRLR
eukprot:2680402-Prymnesium_polylepis.1